MMPNMHTPQLVRSMSRRDSQNGSFLSTSGSVAVPADGSMGSGSSNGDSGNTSSSAPPAPLSSSALSVVTSSGNGHGTPLERSSRRLPSRSPSLARRESSTEENCAYVDKMIQTIQQQICRELGFREINVATGSLADDSGSPLPSVSDLAQSAPSRSSGVPMLKSKGSMASITSMSSSYSEDMRQAVGEDLWESIASSKMGYLYGLKRKASEANSDSSNCSECARGTVYVSPHYDTKKRLLVIVPYREAGIWSRSICMQQQGPNDETGSMLAYLRKAMREDYGVIIMNPAAQVCHPRQHVEQVWDQLVVPLESEVFIIAFSRGCQFVKHLLVHDNGEGIIQDRVRAMALVEPSHYVSDSDPYFARRILARRAIAWILSSEIAVGQKIPKAEARHGCVCISAGTVPSNVTGSSGAWALEIVKSSVFGSFAARCGEAAGVTVNEAKITSCGICHRKLGVLNRKFQCTWCEVKYCSHCCEDKFVDEFGNFRVCSLCQIMPCLIDPRRKNRHATTHSSPKGADMIERCSVFIQPTGDEPLSLGDFEIIKLIGRGACGRVKLVRKKHGSDEGDFYAMKAIKKKLVIQRGLVEATNAERRILDRINHPYIATLCYAFQSDAKLYLLSKYYPGGNLLDQMRKVRRFTDDRTQLYAAEVALAINHLHENGIIYRDLKLENVLVGADGHVALTDFGMSKEDMMDDGRTSTFVGTYQMMAPEVFTGKSYSKAVDWWALGVMVYEMIDGRTPFNAKTNKLIKERITNVDLKFSPRFTDDAKDFVAKLLTKEENQRLGSGSFGFQHIKRHPWFKGIDWDLVMKQEQLFEGQEELRTTHAKEYTTKDIFDTYMNTIQVPIDTPASVRSEADEDLFNDFAFNYMDDDEQGILSPDENEEDDGIGSGSQDSVGDEDATPIESVGELDSIGPDSSQFDISLLRPDQATDFDASPLSSTTSDSANGSSNEEKAATELGNDDKVESTDLQGVEEDKENRPSMPPVNSTKSVSESGSLTEKRSIQVEATA